MSLCDIKHIKFSSEQAFGGSTSSSLCSLSQLRTTGVNLLLPQDTLHDPRALSLANNVKIFFASLALFCSFTLENLDF